MGSHVLQAQFSEEMIKFQKTIEELRVLKAALVDLKKLRKMMPHKKYD